MLLIPTHVHVIKCAHTNFLGWTIHFSKYRDPNHQIQSLWTLPYLEIETPQTHSLTLGDSKITWALNQMTGCSYKEMEAWMKEHRD